MCRDHWRIRSSAAIVVTVVGMVGGMGVGCSRPAVDRPVADSSVRSPREVLQHMVHTYRTASSYRDDAVVRLVYQRDGTTYEDEAACRVHLVRPNRIDLTLHQLTLVSDGRQLRIRLRDAETRDFDGQVVVQPAPRQLTVPGLYQSDPLLQRAVTSSLAGYPAQVDLLLAADPFADLWKTSSLRMLSTAELEGHVCHRIEVQTADGQFVFWVDQQQHLLRRLEYPVRAFAPEVAQDPTLQRVELRADFRDARLNEPATADDFAFTMPANAKPVRAFVPPPQPLPSELFGQRPGAFSFQRFDGQPLSQADLDGKHSVLMWFNNHPACRAALEQLERVFQRYGDDARFAFYAVSVEPSAVTDDQLAELCRQWGVNLPLIRDSAACGRDVFQIPWAPTLVVLNGEGVVQIVEVGANPNLAAELPQILERLAAGHDLATEILRRQEEEQQQYAQAVSSGTTPVQLGDSRDSGASSETGPLRMSLAWQNTDLKAPGNIVPFTDEQGTTRLLVHDGWRTVAVFDLQGQLVRRHPVDLPGQTGIGYLRPLRDARGQLMFAAAARQGPQIHLLDDQWQLLWSYPETAGETPVQDLEVADLDDDRQPELYVGFAGQRGIEQLTLEGTPNWNVPPPANLLSLGIACDDAGRPRLLVAVEQGGALAIDAQGQRLGGPSDSSGPPIQNLVGAPAGERPGRTVSAGVGFDAHGNLMAYGFDRQEQVAWQHQLPAGSYAAQVQFLTVAPWLDDAAPTWVLAGPDGSLQFIDDRGDLVDRFSVGQPITGLAIVRHETTRMLIVATPTRILAWQVAEAPEVARRNGSLPTR